MSTADLRDLRRTLARRLREKAELEEQVRALKARVESEVAPLQEEVLRLQMEQLKEAAQARMRSARLRNAYHDAQDAYDEFREQRGRPSGPASGENLKAVYRRASKRCHPDVVPDAYQEQAAATFQALEKAYAAGHARAVEAIAESLEQWGFPRDPAADEEPERTRDLGDLRRAISDLESSIQTIRGTDAYQDLAEADDLDALLQVRKERLRRHLRNLQRDRNLRRS